MCYVVRPYRGTEFELVRMYLALVSIGMFILIIMLVATKYHRNISLETTVDLYFLPPLRLTFTTGKGSLVGQPDYLEVL